MERRISIAGLGRAALFVVLVAASLELGAAGYSALWLDSGYAAARVEREKFLAGPMGVVVPSPSRVNTPILGPRRRLRCMSRKT